MIPDTNSHYAIIAWDGENSAAVRFSTRDLHLVYLANHIGDYAVAGPLRDDKGAFTGSLMIVKASNLAAAEAMLHSDPYYIAGLWDRHSISAFTPAAGGWVGGTTW
jgi:uncharacterized protein